jgi:hypothetical protein
LQRAWFSYVCGFHWWVHFDCQLSSLSKLRAKANTHVSKTGDIKHLKYYSIAFWPALQGHWNAVVGAVLEFREQVIGDHLARCLGSSCWLWSRMGGLWELVSNSGLDSSTVSKKMPTANHSYSR